MDLSEGNILIIDTVSQNRPNKNHEISLKIGFMTQGVTPRRLPLETKFCVLMSLTKDMLRSKIEPMSI